MNLNRRQFVSASAAAGVALLAPKSYARVRGANDRLRVAVAGLNGRGGAHVDAFKKMPGVEIAYLVDPDARVFKKYAKLDAAAHPAKPLADVRKALEDKDLNALSIATPNHWHALMTIWACEAGKDVYVEKPCSHNVHEGRIAVQMARKHKRIVQHGTQSRSSQGWADLAALARSGKLGKLLVSRGLCYKDGGTGGSTRGDIGTKPFKAPPSELNFDLWLGPAREQPYHENLVHYRWHWFWDFGNGDAGNQGVHQMDVARWLVPGAKWPKAVVSYGGRYANKDQGQTPNALVSVFDYGETLLIFETRGLKSPGFRGQSVGNVLHFEEGVVAGGKFYPKGKGDGEPVPKVPADEKIGGDHFGNFVACVRSRDASKLHADLEVGHISSGLCHLGNISYRLGRPAALDPKAAPGFGSEALERMGEHLKDSGIKFDGTSFVAGRRLEFDGASETFVGDKEANALLTREYRKGFAVPERV